MTYDLYDEIVQFQCISKDERLRHVTILIREKLPEDNYHILKYIVQFLAKVGATVSLILFICLLLYFIFCFRILGHGSLRL